MKLKGISVFEQHVEKIFAGIIFVALLVILAWQFLAGPAMVTVNKAEVPLNGAWSAVAEQARGVQSRLNATQPPDGEGGGAAIEQIVSFNEKFRGPVTPARQLEVAIGEKTSLGAVGGAVATTITPLGELTVPAPSTPYGSSHLTLISPAEAEGKPEVAAILPAAMPFDKAGVTVETSFSGTALYDALTTDPDGAEGPARPMPRHWWDNAIQIVDVELQREELGANGQWSGLKTVESLPGKFSLRKDLAQPLDGAAQLKELARLATDYAEQIRRTPYYASAMGEKWTSPAERRESDDRLVAQAGVADEAARVRRLVESRRSDLQRAQQELASAGGGSTRGPDAPPRPSPPPNSGGGKGPGGGGGSGGERPQPPRETSDLRRKSLEGRVGNLTREVGTLIDRLRNMGEDVSMYGAEFQDAAAGAGSAAAGQVEAPLLENPSVRVWAHDVFVERGKTYRYRMVVVLNNPMFGQGNVMVPEQKQWADAAIIRSAPSEWSEPVRVDDETYFFITSANASDRMNRTSSARAEMFIFKWGRWRKGDVQLEPGDRLRAEVKYQDIRELVAQLPAGLPDQPGMPAPIAVLPGKPGGGREASAPPAPSPPPNPSQIDRRIQPGQTPPPAPQPGDNRQDPQGGPRPAPLPMLTERVAVDAILLNVASAQAVEAGARTRSGMVAYLRDAEGLIVPRYPDAERGSIVLARLERSATQGATDFQPNELPVGPGPVVPPPDRERPPPPPPPGGGGGGGSYGWDDPNMNRQDEGKSSSCCFEGDRLGVDWGSIRESVMMF